ncbi:MAG: CopD family protein [Actinobacteria bacterium]|nr:CopD family protein [Actinomycetota bacterium]
MLVRYAALSAGLFATVLVTGTAAALLLVDDVQALVTTAYGRTLLVKLTLVAVVAGLALAGRAAVRRSAAAQSPRSGRLARVEAGALVGVLAVTALLISLSPPRPDGPPAPPTVARQAP